MSRRRAAARGFSLIELMVAVAIGLIVTLAAASVMQRAEGGKRTTVTTNDVNQTASYLGYAMDRTLRSAGSGYVQRAQQAFGCQLRAQLSGSTILPRATAWPVPFASLPTTPRLAPVVIHASASASGSDVLAVMTGNAGYSEAASTVMPASVMSGQLRLRNTLGLRGDDLVLLHDTAAGCVLEQVQAGFAGTEDQVLPFAGAYAAGTVDGVDITTLGTVESIQLISLGNAAAQNRPEFQFIGVGANNTLFSYDLLRLGVDDTPVPIADGVVELRALYGVDSNGDGLIDTWQSPSATGWTAAALQDGSAAAQTNLRRIMAVRVGLVLRAALVERDNVAPASLTLFADLPTAVQRTHTITTANQRNRHRVIEVTVPLRNILLLPLA
jgi:type IV pilus assembly protein PilW